jgi:hypothetical protein
MGEYMLLEHRTNDRPAYKHVQIERYIFYAKRKKNTEGDERWHWWVGSEEKMRKGEGGGFLKVADEATTPDSISNSWQAGQPGGWIDAPKVSNGNPSVP